MLYLGIIAVNKSKETIESYDYSVREEQVIINTGDDVPDLFALAQLTPVSNDAVSEETVFTVVLFPSEFLNYFSYKSDHISNSDDFSIFSRPPPEIA